VLWESFILPFRTEVLNPPGIFQGDRSIFLNLRQLSEDSCIGGERGWSPEIPGHSYKLGALRPIPPLFRVLKLAENMVKN
jgi:hypothetical protein